MIHRGVVHKELRVIIRQGPSHLSAFGREGDHARSSVVGVRTELLAQLYEVFSLLVLGEVFVGLAVLLGQKVKKHFGLSMQVVGVPVGGDVSTMPPDAADGLPAHGLPNVLAVLNVLSFVEDFAVAHHDFSGERRCCSVDFHTEYDQHQE